MTFGVPDRSLDHVVMDLRAKAGLPDALPHTFAGDCPPGRGLDEPCRVALGECLEHLADWLDEGDAGGSCAVCAQVAGSDDNALPRTCLTHWLLDRLYRADDSLANTNAVWRWAYAVGFYWAPVELYSDAIAFGEAYARMITARWEAHRGR